jgi:NADH:ubiquinone oxidoreductase subunit 4 (subunit M)
MMSGVIPCLALYGFYHWPIASHVSGVFISFGLINLLYAGLLSGELREVKQIIGAALIAQRGLIFLGLGVGTRLGWQGAALLTLGGALSGGCLLGLAGELEARTGENRVRELSRLAKKLPHLASLALLATLVVTGCPFSLTFVGALLILVATAQMHAPLAFFGAITGMILSTSGLLRIARLIFFEAPTTPFPDERPMPDLICVTEIFPYGLLLLVNLILGCNPNWILKALAAH